MAKIILLTARQKKDALAREWRIATELYRHPVMGQIARRSLRDAIFRGHLRRLQRAYNVWRRNQLPDGWPGKVPKAFWLPMCRCGHERGGHVDDTTECLESDVAACQMLDCSCAGFEPGGEIDGKQSVFTLCDEDVRRRDRGSE